ncbi:A-kinase anchor protein 13 isoform X2 [Triplophysa rosa]|uniref:A-kinase anchor protein 13 isoform X2 n=2 Tax=Triplophysa rosa TaxID=992332 RepID=UPI0025461099|nr:A-kinase anchor protein 13 isoform X2 [Triplophysa rosa]
MKLSPCQAPVYGNCVLTVHLDDEVLREGEQGEVKLFLLFTGSSQRHLTSTLRVDHTTLQAVCPAHDCCESVPVTLCSAGPDGFLQTLASRHLLFMQDLAFDMAQLLVSAVGRTDVLEESLLLDEHQIPLQECERMDQSLALALRHLTLPPGWSLLGDNTRLEPQETLLHFAARRGLFKVASFLLKQPGAREALNLCNKEGATPALIAQSRGHTALLELFRQGDSDAGIGIETLRQISSWTPAVQHHPSLNTYTLSVSSEAGGAPPNLQADIRQMRRLIACHQKGKGGVAFQQSSESPHTSQLCVDSLETRDPCLEETQRDSLDIRELGFTPFSTKENKACNDRLDLLHNREGDGGSSLGCETTASPLHNGNSENQRVYACENSQRDYTEREESLDVGVVSAGDAGHSSDGLQSRSESESIDCKAPSCRRQQEGTDKAEDFICETSGRAEGENQQDGPNSKEKQQSEFGHTEEAGDMGITQSLDTPESSDVESCSQGAETDDEGEDGFVDALGPEKVKEEPPDLHSVLEDSFIEDEQDRNDSLMNPKQDVDADCSEQSLAESEMHACQDFRDEPGTHELEGSEGGEKEGVCGIFCNVEDSRGHLFKAVDQDDNKLFEDAHEKLEELQESSLSETNGGQEKDDTVCKLSETTSRMVNNYEEFSLQLCKINQELFPVEKTFLDPMVEEGEKDEERCIDTLQTESEPHKPTSEDTLEPDDVELWSSDRFRISCKNLHGSYLQMNKFLCEAQATPEEAVESSMPEDMEIVNLPDDCPRDQMQDMTSNHEVTQATSQTDFSEREAGGVFMHTDQSGDHGILPALLDKLDESENTGISEKDPRDTEDPSSSLVHNDHVGGALHIEDSKEDTAGLYPKDIQESEVDVHEVAQPVNEEDLLKGAYGCSEDQVDTQKTTWTDVDIDRNAPMIHRDKDALCSSVPQKRHSIASPEKFPDCHGTSESLTFRDSSSDTDGFLSPDAGEDNVFRKEAVGGGDSTSEVSVSCSSTDDTASVGHPSSSAESSEEVRHRGEAAEEAKDRLTEVPLRSSLLRSTVRSLSPFRRHSWGPGKNQGGGGEMNRRSSARRSGEEKPVFYRRSLSWCHCDPPIRPDLEDIRALISYSLEGLSAEVEDGKRWMPQSGGPSKDQRGVQRHDSEERGSLVSLTEEGPQSDLGDYSSPRGQKSRRYHPLRHNSPSVALPLTKSISMFSISQRDIDGMRSFTSTTRSMGYSITEEEPGPLRGDFEKSTTKVSRTFSYLKSKMYKKTREKDKSREKEAKDKRTVNGHQFCTSNTLHPALCQQCNKTLNTKDAVNCTICNVRVHKSCRENLPICSKGKMKFQKQQFAIPESTTMPVVTLRTKSSTMRERPWSAILSPEEHYFNTPSRRPTSIMPFHSSNLSKSMSINNIAMFDEMPLKGLRYLSQSTDSLHKPNKVTESTESLDEGTEIIDGHLMGEFEADVKEFEADSWSLTVDKTCLRQLKKDIIKRQDVIYELIQTEIHHVRTLRIMSDVYSKGILTDLQLDVQILEKMFPVLDDLLDLHTMFLSSLLERRRESRLEGLDGGIVINRIGDVLVSQFSESNTESMRKVYGTFCSRHNEAVNVYKEMHARDKRFQAFIRKKMSSSVVRRLGIPECILLVTQRITKYPVLLQRILQHTRENEGDFEDLTRALQLVKDIIASVDSKVHEHDKKRRLKDIYGRTDSKSITRMKSGQMFAREDLQRSGKLLHDGPLQLKNTAGRLKDVHALLLADVLVFLQEKDQKYVFASLDQRATVISLQKLIVREVAHEERGLFLITAGIEKPEMVEVRTSSREERNTWMRLIQDAMHSIEKDEDEGIPSETEEDKKLLEIKTKEMRDMVQRKDEQIVSLLLEKMKLFRDMCGSPDDPVKMLFRANNEEVPKGEPIMMDALKEVEMLQALVNSSLGGAVGQQVACAQGIVGPVCLPRRAETFGGFDSHQMSTCKQSEKEECEDLRRTESDSVLKKGGNANLLLLLKRNSEVLSSVTHLHDLLSSLQAVVLQQDTFIEDQRQALNERAPSRPSSRPPSLVEQEKQRSLERHRQEATALQRQQAAHVEEKRRREREWDARERELTDREVLLHVSEEEARRRHTELEEVQRELQGRKEDYQKDLERLRDAQRRLEREKEHMQREAERVEHLRQVEARIQRTSSSTSEDSLKFQSSGSMEKEMWEGELSCSPRKNSLSRMDSKQKGRSLFSLGGKTQSTDSQNQIPSRLLQLATSKDKKDKKKKKSKNQAPQEAESHLLPLTEPSMDGEIFFC